MIESTEQVAAPAVVTRDAEAVIAKGLEVSRAQVKRKLRPAERNALWLSRIVLAVFAALILFPLVSVFATSFSVGSSFSGVIPSHWTLQHYQNVLNPQVDDYAIWLKNTVIVGTSTALLALLLVATCGYAFSRFRFKGRTYGLMTLLLIQMFPAPMGFIALYYLLLKIGLLNTLQGLVLAYLGGGVPWNAWLFKGYVDGLPRDLEESASVDGASKWQAFYKIILPLTRPMLAVIFVLQFIGIYDEYILANFLISDPGKKMLIPGLQSFIGSGGAGSNFASNWTDFAAAAMLSTIPIMIVFLLANRWLVSGLSAGAVKG